MIAQEKAARQLPDGAAKKASPSGGSIWQEALLPYIISRAALLCVGLLTALYILPLLKSNPVLPSIANTHLPDALWLMWNRFDAGFYVGIARSGYWSAATLQRSSNWIFLPLYPLLIYPLGHFLGSSTATFDISGIIVANLSGLVAVTYLYLLVRREFHAQIAARAVVYLVVFPTSFYLSAVYPESLFLACALACIYYAREKRWWLAGICGALASLARIQGFLLAVPVAWEYWQALSERYAPLPDMSMLTLQQKSAAWLHSRLIGPWRAARAWSNWLHLGAILLIPGGLVPFFIYSKIKTGDALATLHNHSTGWGRHFEFPWKLVISSLAHPQAPNALNWNFWLLNIVTIIAFLGFTLWSLRRLPIVYTLYTLCMVVMPLSTASINSISRYYLVIFPAFILLALWSSQEKQPIRHFLIVTFFVSLQVVLMIFYVLGLPLIA
jgi:hypothetical protein